MADMSAELANRAAAIRSSGLFNVAEYEFRAEAAAQRLDPIHHYLTVGEARGGRPSRRFDPHYYAKKHVIRGDSPLIHYLLFGQKMGLRPLPIATELTFSETRFREGFERCVLLAPHAEDQEGYSIAHRLVKILRTTLDVIVLALDASPTLANLEVDAACVAYPPINLDPGWDHDHTEATYVAAEIADHYGPLSVICCGTRARLLVHRFASRSIPTITLAWDVISAKRELLRQRLYRYSAAIIFESEEVRKSHAASYPWIASRPNAIVPLRAMDESEQRRSALQIAETIRRVQATYTNVSESYTRITTSNKLLQSIKQHAVHPHDMKWRIWENCMVGGLATGGTPAFPVPRILAGVDVRAYAEKRNASGGNPVIDLILEERIDEFRRPVITPSKRLVNVKNYRVALHGHYYYTDLAEELIFALNRNRQSVDLYLSTDTDAKAKELSSLLSKHGKEAEIRVMPNRGRDLGPFFTGFRDLFGRGYDIIGHVHGKKTAHVDSSFGETWRRYLMEHTVGGSTWTLDSIIESFDQNNSLGLVFPEDDRVLGWDMNLEWAKALASRMGLSIDLHRPTFDFPAGSFFWCRPAALQLLLSAGLEWSDYPSEPAPNDGSVLHALERIMTFVCEQSGFEYRTVRIPNSNR